MKIDSKLYSKTFYVWTSVSAMFFYGGVTPFHSHNTLQLVFDLRKMFKCRIQNTGWELYKSVLIKEDAIHQLDTNESVQLILYLDAKSEIANAIKLNYPSGNICSLDLDILDYAKAGELERCLIEADTQLLEKLIHRLLNQLGKSHKSPIRDERIKKIISMLAEDCSEKMTINQMAKNVFLSESRLRSLFKKVEGVSLHRYIIWNRIRVALSKIMNGSTVLDAAMECGFTDGSHFHKLLVKMFGVSPSQFIKNNEHKSILLLTPHPLDLKSQIFNN